MDAGERDALIAALERIGQSSPRARTLSVVHRGLSTRSSAVDVEDWSRAFQETGAPAPAIASYELQARLQSQTEVLRSKDPAAHLELAEAFLARAFDVRFPGNHLEAEEDLASLLFLDAHRTALEAEKLGATGWRVNAVIALAAYYLKNFENAHTRAEAAVAALPSGEQSFNAMATLELFAKMRCQAIARAVREKKDGPSRWLTDVNAACSVLARHPLGTDAQVAWHYDLLKWLGGGGQAALVLDGGLARFADSWALHERLRERILEEKGVEGLEVVYGDMLRQKGASASLEWFAGHASLVAAEFHRRAKDDAKALASYERAIAQFARSIEEDPESRAGADHQIALAMAARARLACERKDYETALEELLQSFERSKGSAGTLDGLNISPADTARLLRARLTELGRSDLLKKLEAALEKLDPELLALPAYEQDVPLADSRPRRRRPGQGGE
jgi:tetratricopeptide (TPR) repeat protein